MAKTGYTKKQFLASQKYADKKDILNALLEDEKKYSMDEVDNLIEKFMKKEAK